MPTTSKPHRTYHPLSPPKHQQRFTARRRSVRMSAPRAPVTKSQSTLTQLEFCTPRSTSAAEVECSCSDESDEYVNENENDKGGVAKKRRRKTKTKFDSREAGQSSMTQFERGEFPSSAKRARVSLSDGRGGGGDFEVWEDYSPQAWEVDTQIKIRRREISFARLRGGGYDGPADNQDEDEENDAARLEIPESSQTRVDSSPPLRERTRRLSSVLAGTRGKRPRFETPRKVRFGTEVPSSQSPSNTAFSTPESFVEKEVMERSPLKERSANLSRPLPSPPPALSEHKATESRNTSQNTSMKMLDRVKFGKRSPLTPSHPTPRPTLEKDTASATPSPEKIPSSQPCTLRETASTTSKAASPPLKRVTTIQDSQPDNDEPFTPEAEKISYILTPIPEKAPTPRPRLRRTLTVQNSQQSDDEVLADDDCDWDRDLDDYNRLDALHDDNLEYGHGDGDGDGEYYAQLQSTYDPVFSALDRDAERFIWGTQGAPRAGEEDGQGFAVQEEEEEDLDIGCLDKNTPPLPPSPDVKSISVGGESHPTPSTSPMESRFLIRGDEENALALARHALRPSSQVEQNQGEEEGEEEEIQVPSSSPPQPQPQPRQRAHSSPSHPQSENPRAHPSQISTVVPTQPSQISHSHSHSHSHSYSHTRSLLAFLPPETMSMTISSSPLLQPPWSSPSAEKWAESTRVVAHADADAGIEMEELVDFSLPPPPRLLSSSRGESA